jgi:hypothetical protein
MSEKTLKVRGLREYSTVRPSRTITGNILAQNKEITGAAALVARRTMGLGDKPPLFGSAPHVSHAGEDGV